MDDAGVGVGAGAGAGAVAAGVGDGVIVDVFDDDDDELVVVFWKLAGVLVTVVDVVNDVDGAVEVAAAAAVDDEDVGRETDEDVTVAGVATSPVEGLMTPTETKREDIFQ